MSAEPAYRAEDDFAAAPTNDNQPGRQWVTHPFAEFINSLCPAGNHRINLDWDILEPGEAPTLVHALNFGFNTLAKDHNNFLRSYGRSKRASMLGLEILLYLNSRTLGFNKLMESAMLTTIVNGQTGADGNPQRDGKYNVLVAPGIGGDPSNVDLAIKILIATDFINRVPSRFQPDNPNCRAYVYTSSPINYSIDILLDGFHRKLKETRPSRADFITDRLSVAMEPLFKEYGREADVEADKCKVRVEKLWARQARHTASRKVKPVADDGL